MKHFSILLVLSAFSLPIAAGQSKLPGMERSELDSALKGRVLMEEANCVACHQTRSAELAAASRQAPRLAEAGGRIRPDHLRTFLANPHATKPGTLMPDVMGELSDKERDATAESITHYLVSRNRGKPFSLQAPDAVAAERGEALFHSVGCVACHSPRDPAGKEILGDTSVPLGDVNGKYSIRSLGEFLKRPHAVRPSGRMPDLKLPGPDLERIAHYLLRETRVPGHLSYILWRGRVWEGLDGEVEKERAGQVDGFSLEHFGNGRLPHQTAIRFEGFLKIETAGDYTFFLEMNGGTLRLNDADVINEAPSNRRGPKSLRANVRLEKGWTRVELTYFHTGREPRFTFEMEGPGFERGPIPPSRLSIADHSIPAFEPLVLDPENVAQGKLHFERLGCVQCHDDLQDPAAKPVQFPKLAELDPKRGCLTDATETGPGIPDFHLSPAEKQLIREALPNIENKSLTDAQVIDKTLVALNCLACHERKGLGGIDPARDAYFTGSREALGNQGRLPPPLTHVGAKLTKEWMTEVLLRGGRQREYLNTRMPQFGEANVAHLIERFEAVDADTLEDLTIPKVSDIRESKEAGYHMMGAEGFSCIACHDYNGQKSAGAGALDLVHVARRLKKNWFHLYMREPYRFHPTVIMPSYWPGGQSIRKEVLDGDPDRQIEALWTYLSDGDRAKPPKGLSRQSNQVRVANETVMVRGRGTAAGYRGIGVGYPERISLAFDSEQLALRLLWKGEFADINHGRFNPRGRDRVEFPAGIPFHRLASMDAEWPYKGKTDHRFPQDHGYQYRGYSLDSGKRPAFRYHYGEVVVEDFFRDHLDEAGAPFFRRTLTFSVPSKPEPFYFRVASGKRIERKENEWRIDRLRVRLLGDLDGEVREGDPEELLVPLELPKGKTVIELEYQW